MGFLDNGVLGAAGSLADDLGQSPRGGNEESYPAHYNVDRFDSFGGTLTEGKPVEIARDEIPAGLARRWGYGRAKNPANQGYAYGIFQNSGDGTADSEEQIHGKIIFQWENSTGRSTQVVHELDTEDMDTADRYDRDTQPPMPEQVDKNRAEQDQSLVVLFEPTTPAADIANDYAISAEFSECRLPATEYDLS